MQLCYRLFLALKKYLRIVNDWIALWIFFIMNYYRIWKLFPNKKHFSKVESDVEHPWIQFEFFSIHQVSEKISVLLYSVKTEAELLVERTYILLFYSL